MDPAIELATLIVGYLWPLKELFPGAEHVADLASPLARLHDCIDCDYAMVARLSNVASRTKEESWGPEGTPVNAKDPGAALREIVARRVRGAITEEAQAAHASAPRTRTRALADRLTGKYREFDEKATGADYEALARETLQAFIAHAGQLCAEPTLARLRLAEGDADETGATAREATLTSKSRDRFALLIAVNLVRHRRLEWAARTLDFCPLVIQQLWCKEKKNEKENPPPRGKDWWTTYGELLADERYPCALIARCNVVAVPLPFSLVQYEELDEIDRQRSRRRAPGAVQAPAIMGSNASPGDGSGVATGSALAAHRAFRRKLLGVAISGGGIRSATFALGVLQGLAHRRWLTHVDYLSTVSGGGYIGSWLLAWIKRRGSAASVQESLQGYHACGSARERNPDPGAEHQRPIRLLRDYSNYLAPQGGAFSTDTWTVASIWIRNTALNLLTLTLFLMAALMAPRILGIMFVNATLPMSLFGCAASIAIAAVLVGLNLQTFDYAPPDCEGRRLWSFVPRSTRAERGDAAFLIFATIVVPMMLATFFAVRALWLQWDRAPDSYRPLLVVAWIILWGGLALTAVASQTFVPRKALPASALRGSGVTRRGAWRAIVSIACGCLPALVGALVIAEVWKHVFPILSADTHRGTWLIVAFGPVVLIADLAIVIILYLGFEGLAAADERREWWSRLGAWLGIIGTVWATVTLITYFAPYLIARGGIYLGSLTLGWGTLTAIGAWLAASGKSNGVNLPFDRNIITSTAIAVAPYLFMFGFLIGVTVLAQGLEFAIRTQVLSTVNGPITLPFSLVRFAETYWSEMRPEDLIAPVIAFALLAAAFILAWRVDVNEFSMHHFYKNRLVRAYLGASRSRRHRRPNAFTGLDMDDDIKLWRFTSQDPARPNDVTSDCRASFDGPYPIFNTTLNMTTGAELAYRERKGQSFVFTPLYCGYDFATKQTVVTESVLPQFALRPTREFGASSGRLSGVEAPGVFSSGLGVGTAVAISGAAANPNAGYHSSPAVAFLLTVFNARLGWWIGNPRSEQWRRASPVVGLTYLLSELFGFSSTKRRYVNLSDGGHFDNMGLYELVRRRCRYIVLIDGEQDDKYSFNGLSGAIRKCRVDFGIVIEIDTDRIRPRRSGSSPRHVAVGTIAYPEGCGTLVYIKASMTGDEPMDVKEYHSAHKEFPHQTTADQFFNESQFESYRALGQHISDEAFPPWAPAADESWDETVDRLFKDLRSRDRAAHHEDPGTHDAPV